MTTRPMRLDDTERTHAIFGAAFGALDSQSGTTTPMPDVPLSSSYARSEQLLATDPGGCWVAEVGDQVVGAAMALRRGGLWGLSLLIVDPDHQSGGVGRELLDRAHGTAADATGRVILASSDPRALRAYSRLGLAMSPALGAHGRPRDVRGAPTVRQGGRADLALAAAIDTEVRGAPHGDDLEALMRTGAELSVYPGRGYVLAKGGDVKLLAALDEEAARDLLLTAVAGAGDGVARVLWLTAEQQWAIDLCVEIGLELDLGFGAVMRAGRCGTYRHYLPSGTYL